eukprot:555665_1
MISMYISFSKSHLNGTFGKDIVILDPLEAKQIKILPLSMYFSCANGRLCGIIKQAYFYEYGYSIPFAVSNTGWFESVHLPLLINNDISTCFVGQNQRNEIYTHSFRNNWVINSKTSTTGNDNSYSTMLDNSIMPIKIEFNHVYGTEFVNVCYPSTMESSQWLWMLMLYNAFSINIYEFKIHKKVIKKHFSGEIMT